MKNRVLTFIIGILLGSIITTAGFLIYNKTINRNTNLNGQMQPHNGEMGEPPEKPQGDFSPHMQNNYLKNL